MSDLTKTIWIAADLDIVHRSFTEADRVAAWSGVAAKVEPRVGGIYELDMGAAGTISGRFVTVEADFIVQEFESPSGGPPSRIEICLTPEADGTRVHIRHSGLRHPFDQIASRGWDHHLARLSVRCTGGDPGPDPLCDRPMDSLADGAQAARRPPPE